MNNNCLLTICLNWPQRAMEVTLRFKTQIFLASIVNFKSNFTIFMGLKRCCTLQKSFKGLVKKQNICFRLLLILDPKIVEKWEGY